MFKKLICNLVCNFCNSMWGNSQRQHKNDFVKTLKCHTISAWNEVDDVTHINLFSNCIPFKLFDEAFFLEPKWNMPGLYLNRCVVPLNRFWVSYCMLIYFFAIFGKYANVDQVWLNVSTLIVILTISRLYKRRFSSSFV